MVTQNFKKEQQTRVQEWQTEALHFGSEPKGEVLSWK